MTRAGGATLPIGPDERDEKRGAVLAPSERVTEMGPFGTLDDVPHWLRGGPCALAGTCDVHAVFAAAQDDVLGRLRSTTVAAAVRPG